MITSNLAAKIIHYNGMPYNMYTVKSYIPYTSHTCGHSVWIAQASYFLQIAWMGSLSWVFFSANIIWLILCGLAHGYVLTIAWIFTCQTSDFDQPVPSGHFRQNLQPSPSWTAKVTTVLPWFCLNGSCQLCCLW